MKITKTLITKLTEAVISSGVDWMWEDAPRLHKALQYAIKEVDAEWEIKGQIIAVRAKTSGPTDPVIGYATGTSHDIEAFFDDKEQYGLTLEPITVNEVPSGFAAHRNNIIAKRDRLQAEIDRLNKELKTV